MLFLRTQKIFKYMFMPIIAPTAPFVHTENCISIDDGELISEKDQDGKKFRNIFYTFHELLTLEAPAVKWNLVKIWVRLMPCFSSGKTINNKNNNLLHFSFCSKYSAILVQDLNIAKQCAAFIF